jgi:hypothetical protein
MYRYSYAVCTEDGKPIEQTFANVAVQASAPRMYEFLRRIEAEGHVDRTELIAILDEADGRKP